MNKNMKHGILHILLVLALLPAIAQASINFGNISDDPNCATYHGLGEYSWAQTFNITTTSTAYSLRFYIGNITDGTPTNVDIRITNTSAGLPVWTEYYAEVTNYTPTLDSYNEINFTPQTLNPNQYAIAMLGKDPTNNYYHLCIVGGSTYPEGQLYYSNDNASTWNDDNTYDMVGDFYFNTVSPPTLETDLSFYAPMNSSTVPGEFGPYGYAYALTGSATEVQGIGETALDFDGTGSAYIRFLSVNITGPRTTSVWLKTHATTGTGAAWMHQGSTAYALYQFTNYYEYYGGPGGTGPQTGTITPDTWYHIVTTYDPITQNRSVYVNGVFYSSSISSFDDAVATLWISSDSSAQYFNGTIDELAMWERILNDTEVAQLYNTGTGLCYNGTAFETCVQITPPVTLPSPIHYYTFDNATITAGVVTDLIRTETGTLNNSATSGNPGVFGDSVGLTSGTSDSVQFNYSMASIPGNFTYSVWVYPTSLSGSNKYILGTRATPSAASTNALYLGATSGRPTYVFWNESSNASVVIQNTTLSGVPINTWSFIAITYDGTTYKLYVNGTFWTSRDHDQGIPQSGRDTTVPYSIGLQPSPNLFNFDGYVDELAIFNTALTEPQVQKMMNEGYPVTPTPSNDTIWCYQNFPDVSTPCGGVANQENGTRGNNSIIWYQGAYPSPGGSPYITFNYTKPATAFNTSLWMVEYGYNSSSSTTFLLNLTIPPECWNADPTQLYLQLYSTTSGSAGGTGVSYPLCYNGTDYIIIGPTSSVVHASDAFNGAQDPTAVVDGNWSGDNPYATTYFTTSPPTVYWNAYDPDPVGAYLWEQAMWWYLNTTPACTPSWSCNGYETCQTDDNRSCNSVTDLNFCGTPYGGDYSEFTPLSCNYCTSTWSTTYGTCISGNQTVGYDYTNTCCVDTGLPSDCNIPANTTQTCGGAWQPDYSADDVGTSVVDVITTVILAIGSFAAVIGIVLGYRWYKGKKLW